MLSRIPRLVLLDSLTVVSASDGEDAITWLSIDLSFAEGSTSSLVSCFSSTRCFNFFYLIRYFKLFQAISGNYQVHIVENLIKRQSCQLVFDCLHDNICTPFKGYLTKIKHGIKLETMGVHWNFPNQIIILTENFYLSRGSFWQYFTSAFQKFKS